jgi:2-oxo-3-hexenedioate decarboxylase/2-keto-4-pentenoate hydratase
VRNWREIDLAGVTGTTRINGAEAGRGRGSDVMGHPLEALAWLANTLAGRGRSLKRGDLVLTGSMVLVQWLDGPAEVEVSVAGLGEVRVRFDES